MFGKKDCYFNANVFDVAIRYGKVVKVALYSFFTLK